MKHKMLCKLIIEPVIGDPEPLVILGKPLQWKHCTNSVLSVLRITITAKEASYSREHTVSAYYKTQLAVKRIPTHQYSDNL